MKVLLSVIALSSVISTAAQARQFYWTGQSAVSVNSSYSPLQDCQNAAYYQADEGVRNSCVRDYGLRYHVCQNAPVVNVQYIGATQSYGYVTCSVRVFIQVP